MAKQDVLIKKDWLDDVEDLLDSEQMEKLCYGLITYGLYGDRLETDDKTLQMGLNLIYSQMDKMGATYNRAMIASENGANSKMKYDPMEIWGLYQQGLSGADIIRALSAKYGVAVPKSSVYSNKGWQERDNKHPSFYREEENTKEESFVNSENSEENTKITKFDF